jgi:hypothetical protein
VSQYSPSVSVSSGDRTPIERAHNTSPVDNNSTLSETIYHSIASRDENYLLIELQTTATDSNQYYINREDLTVPKHELDVYTIETKVD